MPRARPAGPGRHTWDSLHLFSPAAFSSLPGRIMPAQPGQEYPDTGHVVKYLTDYEQRYGLPVHRPVRVQAVRRDGTRLRVETDFGDWSARAVISATGTWWRPFLPAVPGREVSTGRRLHTTGFRPALSHLAPLSLRGTRGHIATDGTRAVSEPRLHLLGHGDWTGPASATLIGVGRPAREAVRQIAELPA